MPNENQSQFKHHLMPIANNVLLIYYPFKTHLENKFIIDLLTTIGIFWVLFLNS